MPAEIPAEIADKYLDMVMVCPFEAGQGEGAQSLRNVLASDLGAKIFPSIVENINNIERLTEAGIGEEEATIIVFGGAVVKNEEGRILREPAPAGAIDKAPTSQPEPQLAEKK